MTAIGLDSGGVGGGWSTSGIGHVYVLPLNFFSGFRFQSGDGQRGWVGGKTSSRRPKSQFFGSAPRFLVGFCAFMHSTALAGGVLGFQLSYVIASGCPFWPPSFVAEI